MKRFYAAILAIGLTVSGAVSAGALDTPTLCVADPASVGCADALATQERMQRALDEANQRAQEQAQQQWVAEGSRGCALYPESITPACIAENLAHEQARQEAYKAKQAQEQIDAKKREEENTYKNWMADGGRACALYPASITPECEAENLAFEQKRQEAYAAKMAQSLLDAQALAEYEQKRQLEAAGGRVCVLYPEAATAGCIAETKAYNERLVSQYGKDVAQSMIAEAKAALEKAKVDYIQGGRRECTTYPASLKPDCVAENAAYAEETASQIAALEAYKAEHAKLKTVAIRDESGDLLVDSTIPKKVDLLVAKVRLLDKRNRVVDVAEIKYDSTDDPYFVFDDADKSGTFKLEYLVGKKKTSGLAVKIPTV